jgi:glutamate/tyrosine decarboxylase-like PLP-dependent enzyme
MLRFKVRMCDQLSSIYTSFTETRYSAVCWEKAARYLEVEERYWYCKPGQYVLDPKEAVELVDEVRVTSIALVSFLTSTRL